VKQPWRNLPPKRPWLQQVLSCALPGAHCLTGVTLASTDVNASSQSHNSSPTPDQPVFWRVEGSLLNLSAVRPIGFFTWNAQGIAERWLRRGGLMLSALVRPLLYAAERIFATRCLHTLLRGISQDRLDLLGEEYFHYHVKPKLKAPGVARLKELQATGARIVLVSQGLDHVMRPLAEHLGVEFLLANRLEFRDGLATGRLNSPVIRPRQVLARIVGGNPDGRWSAEKVAGKLGYPLKTLSAAISPTARSIAPLATPPVIFEATQAVKQLSIQGSLTGKTVLLIGFTGFIGKVWLAKLLRDLPDIGKVFLLIRRNRSNSAVRRFEKVVEESPLFDSFHESYGDKLSEFLSQKVEIVEGDVSAPGLGLNEATKLRLQRELDVIINSSGLTDFNPDLRQALSINVDATVLMLDFVRSCDHAALLHLSTCYVVGFRDGRVAETVKPNYTPKNLADFDAATEHAALHDLVHEIEARAESDEVTEQLKQQVLAKGKQFSTTEMEAQLRKQRQRWVRYELTEAGMKRARALGWPNTYTLTKSLAESLILKLGSDLPIAIVRPSIVETSTQDPFKGWNEGVNTSAPLSYLLGTFFRQLPSNEKKCLDIIPVDLVCRGMILIAAALVERRHAVLYHLATSAINPCDMRRSIELTGLAHRKYYRAQDDFDHRIKLYFDSIPVTKERYESFSAPRQKQVIQALQRIVSPLPMWRSPLVRRERDLDRVEKLIELYEPFILHNDHIFEAKNVEILSAALPPSEQAQFGYDASTIDWWDYWINVHIPALRKWSYPLIEGRPLDKDESRPKRAFQMPAPVLNPESSLVQTELGS
jgi:thioester reductase-like protein